MGAGPPVLYSLGMNHLTRNMEIPSFASAMGLVVDAGRCVLRYDHRGAGLSQRGTGPLLRSSMVGDVLAVLDAADVERADFVVGGNHCLWMVPFVFAHPERVNRLVLGRPMARWKIPAGLLGPLTELRDSNWETYSETLAGLIRSGGSDHVKSVARLLRESTTRDDYADMVDYFHTNSITDLLPHCKVPALVVIDEDRKVSIADPLHDVAALLPNVRVLRFDSSGPTSDHERLTSDAVLEFLREGWPVSNGREPGHGLSAREREVLALIAAGRTDAQIAEALVIAPATASRHVHNLLTKLGAANRAEAAALAGSAPDSNLHRSV